MFVFGVYDLENGELNISENGAKHVCKNEVDAWILNVSTDSMCQNIVDCFLDKRPVIIDEMYLAFVYNRNCKKLEIFADITTSPYNLYYTEKSGKIYFSTSLKILLYESRIERSLDFESAKSFLSNGYVVGETTLIKKVKKLTFGNKLDLSIGNAVQVKSLFTSKHQSSSINFEGQLLDSMQKSIIGMLQEGETVALPLSNGYDSNLILDTVLKNTDKKIIAFTVGGKYGSNEISAVKDNLSGTDVKLCTELIDESYFEYFSDIIWRLEGSVYESGVFLQYALAKTVKQQGVKILICGEGSDEVQNKYYAESMNRVLVNNSPRDKRYFTYSDPFVGTNLMIMKKSSVMLNSFGITGRYPFKSASVASAAMSVSKKNGTEKKYYKKLCGNLFDEKITKNLKTKGGTTGVRTVVDSYTLEQLQKFIQGNELISEIKKAKNDIVKDSYTKKLRKEQGVKRILKEIRDEGLIRGMRQILNNRKYAPLASLFKQVYLVIFNELFIKNDCYDSFSSEEAPVSTRELLFGKVTQHETV